MSLFTTLRHTQGAEVQLHSFLSSALDEGVVKFTPRPIYHLQPPNRWLGGPRSTSAGFGLKTINCFLQILKCDPAEGEQ